MLDENKVVLYKKAGEVLAKLPPNNDSTKSVDIMLIISILQGIYDLYKCWKNVKGAIVRCKEPRLIDLVLLHRLVRRKVGPLLFHHRGQDILHAVLAMGKEITEDDIKSLVKEIAE